jgi:hypothetical protein
MRTRAHRGTGGARGSRGLCPAAWRLPGGLASRKHPVLTTGPYARHVVYVPFNEPEGNMFGNEEWTVTPLTVAP